MRMRVLLCSILCLFCSFLGGQDEYANTQEAFFPGSDSPDQAPSLPYAGQLDDFVYIDSISILGNTKTKKRIILREINLQPGDRIALADLGPALEQNRLYLMNTGMFTRVDIRFKTWEGATNKIHLVIDVAEGWYLFPVPLFELADRNFNVWWVEQNRSLQRINFGMDFTNLNFTGRMDRLKVGAKFGYTRSFNLRYQLPYINRSQTLGLLVNIRYAQNREVNYATIHNKQEFFRDDNQFLYSRFFSEFAFSYRPKIKSFHNFGVTYHQNQVDDLVATELNPDFFLNQKEDQQYFSARYEYIYDNRNVRAYATAGNYLSLSVEKDGLGLFPDRNGLTLFTLFHQYLPLNNKWNVSLESAGKVSLMRTQQPYNDNRALGFGQYTIHGYEYYIVDGLDLGVLRSSLRYQLFDRNFSLGRLIPLKAYRQMPLKLYLSLNNDIGYVNDPYDPGQNFLNNRLLWGGGLGLDFIVYYDKVFRVEYSLNHLKEGGLFLHFNLGI